MWLCWVMETKGETGMRRRRCFGGRGSNIGDLGGAFPRV